MRVGGRGKRKVDCGNGNACSAKRQDRRQDAWTAGIVLLRDGYGLQRGRMSPEQP